MEIVPVPKLLPPKKEINNMSPEQGPFPSYIFQGSLGSLTMTHLKNGTQRNRRFQIPNLETFSEISRFQPLNLEKKKVSVTVFFFLLAIIDGKKKPCWMWIDGCWQGKWRWTNNPNPSLQYDWWSKHPIPQSRIVEKSLKFLKTYPTLKLTANIPARLLKSIMVKFQGQ